MTQDSNFLLDNGYGIHLVSNQVKEPHHPSPPPITVKIDLFSPLPQEICKRAVKYQLQSSAPSWHGFILYDFRKNAKWSTLEKVRHILFHDVIFGRLCLTIYAVTHQDS